MKSALKYRNLVLGIFAVLWVILLGGVSIFVFKCGYNFTNKNATLIYVVFLLVVVTLTYLGTYKIVRDDIKGSGVTAFVLTVLFAFVGFIATLDQREPRCELFDLPQPIPVPTLTPTPQPTGDDVPPPTHTPNLATWTATASQTSIPPTVTWTTTPTPSLTPTNTSTPTPVPPTPTLTPSVTYTPRPSATNLPTVTEAPTMTKLPTFTPTPKPIILCSASIVQRPATQLDIVRADTKEDSPSVRFVRPGQQVGVIEKASSQGGVLWYKIFYDDYSGWVQADYLNLDDSCP